MARIGKHNAIRQSNFSCRFCRILSLLLPCLVSSFRPTNEVGPSSIRCPWELKITFRDIANADKAKFDNYSVQHSEAHPNYCKANSIRMATERKGRVPYGEESRKYRRTVFSHSDWIAHRNSDRLLTNLSGIFYSGLVRQLQQEVLIVSLVAAAVVFLNNSRMIEFSLPSVPFTLSSPALGLLLVFRTNASYSRWTEASAVWSRITSCSRNLIRMSATFMPLEGKENQQKLSRLSQATWLFNRSLMNQLLSEQVDELKYQDEIMATIDDALLVDRIIQSSDRSVAAMTEISLALDEIPIDEKRRVEIDKSIVILGDCLSTCEKIYYSPVPLVYTRHTARFLSLWMLLLPMALYMPFANAGATGFFFLKGAGIVPAVALVAIFLFGIEELAVQLEEPFSILPLQKFCDDSKQSCMSISSWCIESSKELEQDTSGRVSNETD